MESINVPLKFTEPVDLGPNKIKWSKKALTSDIDANTTDVVDLKFNNVTPGRYRVSLTSFVELIGSSGRVECVIVAKYNGGEIMRKSFRIHAPPSTANSSGTVSTIINATVPSATIRFEFAELSGGSVLKSFNNVTYSILEMLPNHEATETPDWD